MDKIKNKKYKEIPKIKKFKTLANIPKVNNLTYKLAKNKVLTNKLKKEEKKTKTNEKNSKEIKLSKEFIEFYNKENTTTTEDKNNKVFSSGSSKERYKENNVKENGIYENNKIRERNIISSHFKESTKLNNTSIKTLNNTSSNTSSNFKESIKLNNISYKKIEEIKSKIDTPNNKFIQNEIFNKSENNIKTTREVEEDINNPGENLSNNKAIKFLKYKNRKQHYKKNLKQQETSISEFSKDKVMKEEFNKKVGMNTLVEKDLGSKKSNLSFHLEESIDNKITNSLDDGRNTDDIGTKSTVNIKNKLNDMERIGNSIKSRYEKRGIQSKVNNKFSEEKIRTKIENKDYSQNLVKIKRNEKVINNSQKIKSASKLKKQEILKNGSKALGETVKSLLKGKAGGVVFVIATIFFLMFSVTTMGNGTTTTPTFYIMTTDEQNEAYLSHYDELKLSLEEEIEELINEAMGKYDDLVVNGLGPDGKVYDLDFTEWIAILAVEIEQNYKLASYEYQYLEEIFNKMIYYETLEEIYIETRTETHTEIDEDGNETTYEETIEEEKLRLIITVYNKSYQEIKHDLGFDKEQLEWVERLIEHDSLRDRIENIPTSDSFIDSQGKLTDEEIEKYGGKMVHPTNGVGVVTSEYGYRTHPIDKTVKFHSGIDIGGNNNAPIYAAQDGKVIFSGTRGGYGLTVMIQHDNGLVTLYAHCSTLFVTEGQDVPKGEHIASVGNTGKSTGPHLHFEIRKGIDGETLNPRNFL